MVDMQLHLGLLAQHIRFEHVHDKPVCIEPHINLRARHSILLMPQLRDPGDSAGAGVRRHA